MRPRPRHRIVLAFCGDPGAVRSTSCSTSGRPGRLQSKSRGELLPAAASAALKFYLVSGPAGDGPEGKLDNGLAAVSPERTGWFRFYFDDQRGEWSEQVQRLHGYQPGSVTPTTEPVLSHKHPEDRGQVAATIQDITHTRGVFSSRHRIIDTEGVVRWVIVIGTSSATTAVR